MTTDRRQDLERNLYQVRARIAEAERDYSGVRHDSSPAVHLMAVTKFFPASDVELLYGLGVNHVGENRDQEASAKARDLESLTRNAQNPLRWSFIGQLQTNKAKSVVQYATDIHSVDRLSLVKALGKAYNQQVARYENEEASAPLAYHLGGLSCLVQVSLAQGEDTAGRASEGLRGGGHQELVLEIASALEATEGLTCAGVMAVPPLGADTDQAFERLHEISQNLRQEFPHAAHISAGMSTDLESAIRWGSTIVRVGSQILGPRTLVQ
ncbi:YggS family pyridoxal phosphate-dependent enzyme [Rothia sp. ZJ1223]|uniref:YggS family pyridoxal phosphate-dependent enzyme n=1 Tax=Rothia sp. ZJ1223 TaxID=2811098 RepID=UPI0019591072|nr:YggS family pyridoxal phosphate-dependent enzyme [Rothia sp. ZJ1223]MBM7050752.1 YggS family pyridoxal phosphate-dependent enzyme [Rothia sp. ZJ1223]